MKWTITGNLGRDGANMRYTPKGTAVANMSIAENYKDRSGQEKTNWYRVTAWQDLAEKANELLNKGSFVQVEGYSIKVSEWTDKNNETHNDLDFWASKVSTWDNNTRQWVSIMPENGQKSPARKAQPKRHAGPAAPPRGQRYEPPADDGWDW